jgi:hypothetical protein
MDWLVILAVVVIVVLVIRSANRRQLNDHERAHPQFGQLTAVKQATEDDITALGLDLQKLDTDLAGVELDEGARADYQRALDAYEASKQSLAAVTTPSEISNVTTILHEGRYAIACVRARVAGEELPPRRPPCFFDPRHGVSVRDVTWAPDGGEPRQVPACALDAERVESGAEPDARKVMLGSQRVPYWQAGRSFGPWTAGYFGAFGALEGLFLGTMMGGILAGGFGGLGDDSSDDGSDGGDSSDGGDFGSSDYDASGGYDSGGYDSGGYDSGYDGGGGFDGGGDFGGGDFGGGDFGGGDF